LDIEHTGGERQLPAGDVYITNVSVDYESGATDTVAWAELDDGIGPTDAINGEARRVNLGSVGIVQILWQQDDDVERSSKRGCSTTTFHKQPANLGFSGEYSVISGRCSRRISEERLQSPSRSLINV